MKITRFCYIQADRTNQPQESAIVGGGLLKQSIEKTIEAIWPEHAPVEKYNGWGKDNVYIGGLAHTFLVKLSTT